MPMRGYRSRGSSSRRRSGSGKGYYSKNTTNKPTYRTVSSNFKNKITSYQTLYRQTQGSKSGGPTPSNLNTLGKWVEKGAVIQTVSSSQLKRWSKNSKTFNSPASAKYTLTRKFGKTPIKAVCPGKGNNWIVATSQTWKGKTFRFPH